jgi:hypothetical protein
MVSLDIFTAQLPSGETVFGSKWWQTSDKQNNLVSLHLIAAATCRTL